MSAESVICTDDSCRLSHCVECDAHPGECAHTGAARYWQPIVYMPSGVQGVNVGWKVPEHERGRWDAPPSRPEPRPVDTETLSLEALTDLLDPWFPGPSMLVRLAVAYDRDPARTSRLTSWAIEHCDERGPIGLLFTRLRDVGT